MLYCSRLQQEPYNNRSLVTKLFHREATVDYNPRMEHDETLFEFVQILGRIKQLMGDVSISEDEDVNLVKAIEQLRQSGNTKDADELAALVQRADEMKAIHQAKS